MNCTAATVTGYRCGIRAKRNIGLCSVHDPANAQKRADAHSKLAETRRKRWEEEARLRRVCDHRWGRLSVRRKVEEIMQHCADCGAVRSAPVPYIREWSIA